MHSRALKLYDALLLLFLLLNKMLRAQCVATTSTCCVLQVVVGRLSVDVGTLRFYDRQLHMLYVKALVPFTVAAVIFFVVVAVCVYRRHKERLCKYV